MIYKDTTEMNNVVVNDKEKKDFVRKTMTSISTIKPFLPDLSLDEKVELTKNYYIFTLEFSNLDWNNYCKSINKHRIVFNSNLKISPKELWYEILLIHFRFNIPYEKCLMKAIDNFNNSESLYMNRFIDSNQYKEKNKIINPLSKQ